MRLPLPLLPLLVLACAPVAPEGPDTAEPAGSTPPEDTTDTAPRVPAAWRSELLPTGWTPDHVLPDGRFLHDVSYAGYAAGERPLPASRPEPVVDVRTQGADPTGTTDSTAAIQATLDLVAATGGTVWLPAGSYRVDGALTLRTSGVVVAGDGPEATFVHFTKHTDNRGGAGLLVRGALPSDPDPRPLAQDAHARSHEVVLADTTGLAVGDRVSIGWTITPDFVAEHDMTGVWTFFVDQHKPFFLRTITALDGDRVTLDVPLRYDARVRDGARLERDEGYLTEVGVEDLAVSTAVAQADALAFDRHHAIELDRVMDAWVRRVASYAPGDDGMHLQSGGLYVQRSRRVTVADTVLGRAQHRGGGGNGYLFEVSRVSDVLLRDCTGRQGRHNFIQNWDFGTSGVVWLRTTSEGGVADSGLLQLVGYSEFHHSLAMANLVDASVVHDGWQGHNRHGQSSGAGHSVTQSVFWNLTGTGTLRSLQYGFGYVVGTGPELTVVTDPTAPDLFNGGGGTEPEDHVEGLGEASTLEPPSLYEAMLALRLAR